MVRIIIGEENDSELKWRDYGVPSEDESETGSKASSLPKEGENDVNLGFDIDENCTIR